MVNAGSSSVKFQIFDYSASVIAHHASSKARWTGSAQSLGLRAATRDGTALVDKVYEPEKIADVPSAIADAGAWLRKQPELSRLQRSATALFMADPIMIVRSSSIARFWLILSKYCSLAPLHQPNNLAPIRTLDGAQSGARHRLPVSTRRSIARTGPLADRYAISGEDCIAKAFAVMASMASPMSMWPAACAKSRRISPRQRVIVAHLGSGASMCALLDGKSVESTMGFTALDGLPMGTRPGQIDPGVLLYLITDKGMSAPALESFLYRDCGLKGLSGISNDVRELQASKEASAALAIDYFVYRIALNAGMLAAALGGLDAFVFTAGIGENSATIRSRIAEKLAWLGVTLDEKANQKAETLISPADSKVRIHVVPTDEELMIARHTQKLIRK